MLDKTYFISGGGTGGHIYPAFTVVEKLLQNNNNKIYYIGNPKNLEFDIAKNYPNVQFLSVNVSGMPRKFSFSFPIWAVKFIFSWIKAMFYIIKYKPNVIFATGGYVSAPIIFAAITLKKPYMIHDCDSVPGLVSKLAAPKAKIVSVAFENSKKLLKSNNIIYNGNPVREVFFDITKQEARKKLNIPINKKVMLAMGGSQGAKTINDAMSGILKTLTSDMDFFVILQTGKNKYDDVIEEINKIYPEYKENKNLLICPYFEEMVYPMKASDIVIARAGSLSLTEIIYCNLVSILVPYPYAAQDHQRKNAKEMCDKGLSLYIEDKDCNSENLLNKIKEINNETFNQIHKIVENLTKTNPTDNIVEQLNSMIKM